MPAPAKLSAPAIAPEPVTVAVSAPVVAEPLSREPFAVKKPVAEAPQVPAWLDETKLPAVAPVVNTAPQPSAGQTVLDTLAEPLKTMVQAKLRAGLPLSQAIEVSRAQIAHDAALAAAAQETNAKANATAKTNS